MKKQILVIAAAGAMWMPLSAQINSPQTKGYAARAEAMLADRNFQGCIDQCTMALELGDPAMRQKLMWLQAVAAWQGGMPDAAGRITAFVKAFPSAPQVISGRLMLASITFEKGDYPAALRQLEAIDPNALNQSEAEARDYRLGVCRLKLGDYVGASELLTPLQSTPEFGPAATFYLGFIAYSGHDYDTALRLFRASDSTKAPGDMAPYYIAQILFSRGDYQQALNTVRPLRREGKLPEEFADEALRIEGESLWALGSEKEAVERLRGYMKRHQADVPLSTRYIMGVNAYRTGDAAQAVEMLAPVAEQQDVMGQNGALYLGLSYMAQGNNSAALMALDRAVKLNIDPETTENAYYNYAVAKMDGGRIPFAHTVQTLEEFLTRFPQSRYAPQVQEYLVKGYISTDDYEGAMRSINALPESKRTGVVLDAKQRVHLVLGSRLFAAGDYQGALKQLREAERLAARNAETAHQTTLWLGDTHYALGDYPAAEAAYRSYLSTGRRDDPNRPLAGYNLGYALFGQRRYTEARPQFEAAAMATALNAGVHADAMSRVADTYYYGSDFKDAEKAYDEAFTLSPSTGDYPLFQTAMVQGYTGRAAQKVSSIDRLVELFPASPLLPAALTEKALTLASQGKTTEALAVYRRVADEHPATAQGRNAVLQLAILSYNAGQPEQSINYYKKVVQNYPTSAEATVAVEDLTRILGADDRLDELNAFLQSVEGAPQLDAVQRAAIASASLMKKARAASAANEVLTYTAELLRDYRDSEWAEEALKLKADTEFDNGMSPEALADYTALMARASTPTMRHAARMGTLRTARDLGRTDLIRTTAADILASSTGAGADLPEVRFIQACALADDGDTAAARAIWAELAATPANIYGTRSAFSLAESMHEAAEEKTALDAVNALIDANPPHTYWLGRAFILLSDILRAQGETFEADEYLRTLRTNYPGQEPDIFQMIDQRLPQ